MTSQQPPFTLRQWHPTDAASLAKHANSLAIWRNLRNQFPYPYTFEDAVEWIEMAATQPNLFAIVVNAEAVGSIGLKFQDDFLERNAEVGYWLGEAYWGQGIVTAALQQVTDFAFEYYPTINRLFAGIFSFNEGSKRVLEKAGYRHEATLKEAVYKNDAFADELIYAMLRSEWQRGLVHSH